MKKILTILLVSLMVLSLTGCNSKKEEETVKVEEPVVQETVKEEVKEEVTTEPVVEETEVVEEVIEDTVDVTTLSYWVNFLNPDGSVISRKAYKYGSTPVAPLNPTYEDGVIYYNFTGWDKKASPVYGTQTYTALYEKTGYVKAYDDTPSAPSNESAGDTYATLSLSVSGANFGLSIDEDNTTMEFVVGKTWLETLEANQGKVIVLKWGEDTFNLVLDAKDVWAYDFPNSPNDYIGKRFAHLQGDGPTCYLTKSDVSPNSNNMGELLIIDEDVVPDNIVLAFNFG